MEITEAVLYNDDSVCVRYQDGSLLQLAPCASSFRFYESVSSSSCLQRLHFQQITRFTISSLKGKVSRATNWRNQYASRPYLCKDLIEQELISVDQDDASGCTWPQSLSSECIITHDDGSVSVKSLDGNASLTLNTHQQTFTASYLAPISHDDKQLPQQSLYIWLHTDQQSIHCCPECWKYPLQLALAKRNEEKMVGREELLGLCNVSKLPSTLPLTCNGAHLHKWLTREQMFTGNERDGLFWQSNMKVLFKDNITYRIYKNRQKNIILTIDIYPGDGNLFCSDGLSGKFFKYFTTNTTEEKMYNAHKPPPDKPSMTYSTAKVLRQASRLFNFVLHVGLHECCTASLTCWQLEPHAKPDLTLQNNTTPQILETARVPNVGKFVAHSNGHLYISFVDRTLLNVKYKPTISKEELWFNVTLPNGHVVQGNIHVMQGLERYCKMAIEWGEWVNTLPQHREAFYKDTLWNPDNQRIVEAEIGKLTRFNYLLEHGTLNQRLTNAAITHALSKEEQKSTISKKEEDQIYHPSSHSDVTKALQQTSNAIKNIENFLMNSKST